MVGYKKQQILNLFNFLTKQQTKKVTKAPPTFFKKLDKIKFKFLETFLLIMKLKHLR
jgi:hypothetical protein